MIHPLTPDTAISHPRNTRFWLLAIFASAFVLRLLATIMFEGLHEGPSWRGFGADGVEFNAIAANLVQFGEYAIDPHHPTSFRAPGLPFALAGIYALFGANNFVAAHLLLCLIGALLPIAVYLLAREVTGTAIALVAAGLTAIYPNLAYYAIHFSSEPLFTLLLVTALWLFLKAIKRQASSLPVLTHYGLSGLLFGLAALTRPQGFYLALVLALAGFWLGRREWKSALRGQILFLLMLVLPILPWAARNYNVHGQLVLFATNGGSTFWGSNNAIVLNDPIHRGGWVTTNLMPEEKAKVMESPNEAVRDQLEWAYGKAFLASHIRDIPRLSWYKLKTFWTPFCGTPNRKFNLIVGLSYGLLIPFMVAGYWLMIRFRGMFSMEIILLSLPIIITILITLAFYGLTRFRSTIEPILLIFAAEAVVSVFRRFFNSRHLPRMTLT
ncbi:MAG: glycosyltransferase family 39 protein [bacterium]